MKVKIVSLVMATVMLFSITAFSTPVPSGPAVEPTEHSGNDLHDKDELTPEGYVYYKFDGAGNEGTYTLKFNQDGEISENGVITITLQVGKKSGSDYTEVLYWESNISLYSFIVKGGDKYNVYRYSDNYNSDTNLVAPINPSGYPADVSHISVIFNPDKYTPLYKIGNMVFADTDKNGIMGIGEAGVAGVGVCLYNENNLLINATQTDPNGNYLFTDLPAGNYYVKFILPEGYIFTVKGTDLSADNDSNADVLTGKTDIISLTADNLTIDAGLIASHPPIAVDDSKTTEKNTPVDIPVLANDSDPDGDTITVTEVTQGSNGSVTINADGTVKYTPDNDFVGVDTFTYTITDGNGGEDTATVTVTITDIPNNPPTAVDDSKTTEKNTPVDISVLVNDSDPDGDTITVTEVTQGSNGSVTINADGTVKYTPDNDFVGVDTFTYTITDGNGGEDTATVTVTITEPDIPDIDDCVLIIPGSPTDPVFESTEYDIEAYAGNGIRGFSGQNGSKTPQNFVATSGELNGPRGIAVDYDGNIYIADERNGAVRMVTDSNVMSTLTGNGIENGYTPADYTGPAYGQGMYEPMDVIVCSKGYIIFLDSDHHIVRAIDPNGNLITIAGVLEIGSAGSYSDGGGNAKSARFNTPQGIAIDAVGNIYVADTNNHIIRKISKNGTITNIAGTPGIGGFSGDGGDAEDALLNKPMGLAFNKDGDLYIADTFNHRIRKIDMSTGIITTVAGSGNLPTNSGTVDGIGDDRAAVEAMLFFPHDVAVDAAGNLYIADTQNHRVRKVIDGFITTIAGDGYMGSIGNGDNATKARLNSPKGVAVDGDGNVFVADTENNVIRVLVPKE
ncbi:MAG: Serine-aspartate repeat-containing protein D precursor [Firmicutes bacterium ADurb.Bin193]|nr:MAG: Serine-aspartate repeat-containing protein D precursor [Firmicutes bacterium ADurb.Bin193]